MNEVDTHEVELLRDKVKNGLDIDEAIRQLHRNKCSITESMKFLVYEYQIGLRDAKNKVSNHPVWRDVVDASKPLHDEFIEKSQRSR